MLELDVAPIDVAQSCKAFEQSFEVWDLLLWTTRVPEITNCGNFSALLRARRERPCGSRAAECGQQFPPSDGDCHAPLPREVRRGNDSTPMSVLSLSTRPGRSVLISRDLFSAAL